MAVISLLSLIIVIAVGVYTKKNIGIISLAVAIVLGIIGGMSSKDVISWFSYESISEFVWNVFLFRDCTK